MFTYVKNSFETFKDYSLQQNSKKKKTAIKAPKLT